MGVILSKVIPRKNQIPDMVEISEQDIDNIKRSWEIPRAVPMDAGEAILLRYFEVYPHWQNRFEHFKNSPLLTLKGAPGFRTHAGRIVKLFDDTIQQLGSDDFEKQLNRIWQMNGRNHFRRTIPMQAFLDLKKIILDILTELCELTDQELQSWEKFFSNTYHVLFTTMESIERQSKRRH